MFKAQRTAYRAAAASGIGTPKALRSRMPGTEHQRSNERNPATYSGRLDAYAQLITVIGPRVRQATRGQPREPTDDAAMPSERLGPKEVGLPTARTPCARGKDRATPSCRSIIAVAVRGLVCDGDL